MYKVNESKCDGCGTCAEVCPLEAISLQDGKATIDGEKCTGCSICETECPNDAIFEI